MLENGEDLAAWSLTAPGSQDRSSWAEFKQSSEKMLRFNLG